MRHAVGVVLIEATTTTTPAPCPLAVSVGRGILALRVSISIIQSFDIFLRFGTLSIFLRLLARNRSLPRLLMVCAIDHSRMT